MSLTRSHGLRRVAQIRCRELRKRQTPAEALLWSALRNRRFLGFKFNRQHPIFHDFDGIETFFIADFFCHELKLVIEVDGPVHTTQAASDRHRDLILRTLGLRVLHFENTAVIKNLDATLQAIEAVARRQVS